MTSSAASAPSVANPAINGTGCAIVIPAIRPNFTPSSTLFLSNIGTVLSGLASIVTVLLINPLGASCVIVPNCGSKNDTSFASFADIVTSNPFSGNAFPIKLPAASPTAPTTFIGT